MAEPRIADAIARAEAAEKRAAEVETAAIQGAIAAAEGKPLCHVADSRYVARSAKGDAWERGWQYAAEQWTGIGDVGQGISDGCHKDLEAENAALREAAKAMLDLESRRMYECDMSDDAKVQPCPCPGCRQLRAALAGPIPQPQEPQ